MLTAVRKQAYLLLLVQLVVVVVLFVVWLIFDGMLAGGSAILGGLVAILPNWYFIHRLFADKNRTAAQFIRTFYIGELLKLLSSVTLLVLVLHFMAVHVLAVLSGYIVAYLAILLLPLFLRKAL